MPTLLIVKLLAVFIGGGVGSCLRYLLGLTTSRLWGDGFPHGTLAANLIGCFLMGVAAHWCLSNPDLSPVTRVALTTGLLGGFTTFSAFSGDALKLVQQGSWASAAFYVGSTVIAGLVLVFLGFAVGRAIFRGAGM